MRTYGRPRALFTVVGVFLLGGCYSYVPVERPAPRTVVRVQIPVTSAASNPNLAPETIALEGPVISFGDSLIMETKSRRELGAFREVFEVDTLRVDPSTLVGLDERVFSQPKTIGLTALVTGAAVGIVLAAIEAGGGGNPGDGGGGTGVGAAIKVGPIISELMKLVGG